MLMHNEYSLTRRASRRLSLRRSLIRPDKLTFCLSLFAMALTISGSALAFYCPEEGPCACTMSDTDITVKLTLPNQSRPQRFLMDSHYLAANQLRSYQINPDMQFDGLILRIYYENFTPWPQSLLPKDSSGPYLSVFYYPFDPPEEQARWMAGIIEGRTIPKSESIPEVPGPFDLTELKLNPRSKNIASKTLYFHRDAQNMVETYIYCRPDSPPLLRLCTARSIGDPVGFEFSLPYSILEKWQTFHLRLRELLRCMTDPLRINK